MLTTETVRIEAKEKTEEARGANNSHVLCGEREVVVFEQRERVSLFEEGVHCLDGTRKVHTNITLFNGTKKREAGGQNTIATGARLCVNVYGEVEPHTHCITHSHSHPHTHTLAHTHSHTRSHTLTHSLTLSHTLTHSHTHTHSLSLSGCKS